MAFDVNKVREAAHFKKHQEARTQLGELQSKYDALEKEYKMLKQEHNITKKQGALKKAAAEHARLSKAAKGPKKKKK